MSRFFVIRHRANRGIFDSGPCPASDCWLETGGIGLRGVLGAGKQACKTSGSAPGDCLRFFLLCLSALLLGGCAAFNPQAIQLSGHDREQALAAFTAFAAEQKECPAAIEAGFSVDFDSFWRNSRVEGEVRVKAPAAIKLTAVDPLGRPVLIIASGGDNFVVINIPEATVYTGSLDAAKVKALLPHSLAPDLFYLLIGRLPPGEVHIRGISTDRGTGLVRIRFSPADNTALIREVVFDCGLKRIMSQTVFNRGGRAVLTLNYSHFKKLGCGIPTEIGLVSPGGRLSLNLQGPDEIKDNSGFDDLAWPSTFKQVTVK